MISKKSKKRLIHRRHSTFYTECGRSTSEVYKSIYQWSGVTCRTCLRSKPRLKRVSPKAIAKLKKEARDMERNPLGIFASVTYRMDFMGQKVKDKHTGFAGIATAKVEYENGCIQWEITPDKLVGGKVLKSIWIDEQRVILRKAAKGKSGKKRKKAPGPIYPRRTGGPQNEPPGMNEPHPSLEEVETW